MANFKAFFHGRGRNSHGWDGNVLVAQVPDDFPVSGIFDKNSYKDIIIDTPVNYYVRKTYIPTLEERDSIVEDIRSKHEYSFNNPEVIEEPEDPIITLLKDKNIIKTDSIKKRVEDLDEDDKAKDNNKTAPMQKLEALDAIILGAQETNVDDYVENNFNDEEQLDLALKVKEIKDNKVI